MDIYTLSERGERGFWLSRAHAVRDGDRIKPGGASTVSFLMVSDDFDEETARQLVRAINQMERDAG